MDFETARKLSESGYPVRIWIKSPSKPDAKEDLGEIEDIKLKNLEIVFWSYINNYEEPEEISLKRISKWIVYYPGDTHEDPTVELH